MRGFSCAYGIIRCLFERHCHPDVFHRPVAGEGRLAGDFVDHVQSVHYQQEQESQYNQLQIEEAGRQQLLVGDKERQEIAQEWAQSAQVQEQGAQRQERVGESRLQEEEERLDFREEELSSLQAEGERLELYYQQVVEEGQAWEDEELEEIGPLLDLKG